ncbi:MAG: hypothetical protein QOJ23_2135 [Actinomycetota bacterium]|jgi:hypothetical protein|nr:hypothetical protein [Actinomycetota bacterium]
MDHLDGTTVHEREQTVIGVVKMWGARVWSGAAITGEMSPYGTPDRTMAGQGNGWVRVYSRP